MWPSKVKRRIVVPDYPEIRLVYVSDSILELGVITTKKRRNKQSQYMILRDPYVMQ